MSQFDDYARVRELGRARGIVVFGVFVLVMGLAVAFAVRGAGGFAIATITVGIAAFFAMALVRVPRPAVLTPLFSRARAGAWPATAAAAIFPQVLERYPRLSSTSEMTGVLTFSQLGVRWEPSTQSARSFGLQPVFWDAQWTAQARRLRGFGGLVQLTLTSPQATQSVTLWMRRASTFEIP
ncbi:MAG TPA: hypothetical protein VGM94_09920 [Galbitalea sp.]|jgi:hypothetical protein